MKKRLLITSIVMMLVVAVALSTATYAWFTSNASVTATSITMYAATSDAASIGISWIDGSYGTSIAATSPSSSFKYAPTCISDLTAETALGELTWTSATLKDVAGVATFNDDMVTSTAASNLDALCYTWKGKNANEEQNVADHTSFFIHNGSATNTLSSVTATVTITGTASDFIRVAFFRKDTNVDAFKLLGVIYDGYTYTAATGKIQNGTAYYNNQGELVKTGTSEDTDTDVTEGWFTRTDHTGTINAAVGTASGALSTITDTQISTSVNLRGLAADDGATGGNDIMELKVIVWMDGTALNDQTAGAGKNASVALNFTAARGNYTAPFAVQEP